MTTDRPNRFKSELKPGKPLAIGLLSGGLDSILAARVIQNQGIRVLGFHFITPFFGWQMKDREEESAQSFMDKYGIDATVRSAWPAYLEVVRNPRFGYGKNINPCVDCKIFMLRLAAGEMKRLGADFIFTGEVLGQRPMSQRRDALHLIENESGLKGKLVRPLSALLLPDSIPEKEGLLDREQLLDIRGRSRRRQMELARQMGIEDYPAPAGGCLLTEKNYSRLLKNLLRVTDEPSVRDIEILSVGRHFTAGGDTRLTVGRNLADNEKLILMAGPDDILFETPGVAGPISILQGRCGPEEELTAARVCARYSDHEGPGKILVRIKKGGRPSGELSVVPFGPDEVEPLRL